MGILNFLEKIGCNHGVTTKTTVIDNVASLIKKGVSIEEQIGKSFFSAQDEIIKEANKILSNSIQKRVVPDFKSNISKEEIERIKSLKSLGFDSFEDSYKLNEHNKKLSKYYNDIDNAQEEYNNKVTEQRQQEELIELIKYYQQKYPFQRFIDEKTLMKVCTKYDLLIAEPQDYIAEIPEKNQNQIIKFKVQETDINKDELEYQYVNYVIKNYLTGEDPKFFAHNDHNKANKCKTLNDIEDFLIWECSVADRFSYVTARDLNLRKGFNNWKKKNPHNTGLLICAPKDKLNTENKKNYNNRLVHDLSKVTEKMKSKYKNDDPIVLQPVKGGYLIVSAWGIEASDENVTNSINN